MKDLTPNLITDSVTKLGLFCSGPKQLSSVEMKAFRRHSQHFYAIGGPLSTQDALKQYILRRGA